MADLQRSCPPAPERGLLSPARVPTLAGLILAGKLFAVRSDAAPKSALRALLPLAHAWAGGLVKLLDWPEGATSRRTFGG